MEDTVFRTRFNVMAIHSMDTFADISGGVNRGCKDVYFVRCVGCAVNYLAELEAMDRKLCGWEQSGRGHYIRICELPRLTDPGEVAYYSGLWERWEQSGETGQGLKHGAGNRALSGALGRALGQVRADFKRCSPNASASMEKNFMVKLMFWADQAAGVFLDFWDGRSTNKFVLSGRIKKQEYLFCRLLALAGIDVLLLLPACDVEAEAELLGDSIPVVLGEGQRVVIPPYDASQYRDLWENRRLGGLASGYKTGRPKTDGSSPAAPEHAGEGSRHGIRADVSRPDRDKVRRGAARQDHSRKPAGNGRELEFEELARLASSVVMIAVHDQNGEVMGTGSGIMVGTRGYILTNNHVANGGCFYSVRIEDDETPYRTDEVIKYNPVLDLAVIRINRALKPIPVYQGPKPLARGQKVVAIGSPLGLFNSVSDGIISGFRQIDQVDMIQFTAPISHGSSGGAVLNLSGEVIGISTAGFDGGQNINLAVDYRCINPFIQGFV